jgi:hypothetical protein
MTRYTFIYTDWNGRKNVAERYATNEIEATEKFKLLYPNTYILNIN